MNNLFFILLSLIVAVKSTNRTDNTGMLISMYSKVAKWGSPQTSQIEGKSMSSHTFFQR